MPKQEKKTSMVWAIIITFLMVSSVLGYALFGDSTQKQRYGDYQFTRTEQGWITKINNKKVFFNFHPLELENINLTQDSINSIKNTNMLYLTFDPEQRYLDYIDLLRFQLTEQLWTFFNIYPENGITNLSQKYNLTIITCANATTTVPVLLFKQANETGFYQEDSCIIAQSKDGYGFLRLKDRLLYGVLGIIK